MSEFRSTVLVNRLTPFSFYRTSMNCGLRNFNARQMVLPRYICSKCRLLSTLLISLTLDSVETHAQASAHSKRNQFNVFTYTDYGSQHMLKGSYDAVMHLGLII